jgi:hypothetical protein
LHLGPCDEQAFCFNVSATPAVELYETSRKQRADQFALMFVLAAAGLAEPAAVIFLALFVPVKLSNEVIWPAPHLLF